MGRGGAGMGVWEMLLDIDEQDAGEGRRAWDGL